MKQSTSVPLLSIISFIALTMMSSSYVVASKTIVKIGSMAPNFTLSDDTNTLQALSDMHGSRVALYFYPKDNSPWCTKQARGLNNSFEALRNQNIHVWGVNYDSIASHKAFKAKYNLTFPLLSDSNKEVATAYGANGWFFANRVTFLIDEKGIIVGIIKDIDLNNHAQQILNGFASSK